MTFESFFEIYEKIRKADLEKLHGLINNVLSNKKYYLILKIRK